MDNHHIITICREFGAEGHEIGKQLSLQLDIPLYDKDILAMSAEELGVTIDSIAGQDEKFQRDYFDPCLLVSNEIPGAKLFRTESGLIRQIAEKGPCIIVGRLSDYILRNTKNCIKVLICAPFEQRVGIVAAKRSITHARASALVREMDGIRSSYYRFYTKEKWTQYTDKDIVLNRRLMDIDSCVNLLKTAYFEIESGTSDRVTVL